MMLSHEAMRATPTVGASISSRIARSRGFASKTALARASRPRAVSRRGQGRRGGCRPWPRADVAQYHDYDSRRLAHIDPTHIDGLYFNGGGC